MGTSSSSTARDLSDHNVNLARAQARRDLDARLAARLVGGQQTCAGGGAGGVVDGVVGGGPGSRSGAQATTHQPDPPDAMPQVLADSAIDAAVG